MKKITVLVLALFTTISFAQERYILKGDKHLHKMKKEGKLVKVMKDRNLVVKLSKKEAKKLNAMVDMKMSISAPPPGKGPNKDGGGDSGTNDPTQETPWGIDRVGALNLAFKGDGVRVCVVDTGISKSHNDLNVTEGENFVVIKGKVRSGAWDDDNGHGSHVAGTIAALDNEIGVVGVAPNATLIAMKVLDRRGSGYLSDVSDGVLSCIEKGAHIISMSLGGNGDPNQPSPLKSAIDQAHSLGIKVVVASGNESQDISGKVPAGYSNVIAVGATDINDNMAYFSNYGLSSKDYVAPGVSIKSTWTGNQYNTISGTSMATPHVAGIMALIIQSNGTAYAESLGHSQSQEGSGLLRADLSVGTGQ